MAGHVLVGGSRKNPAIEKMNYSKVSAEEKACLFLAEMKAIVLDTKGKPEAIKEHNQLNTQELSGHTQPKAPNIPLSFFKDVSKL